MATDAPLADATESKWYKLGVALFVLWTVALLVLLVLLQIDLYLALVVAVVGGILGGILLSWFVLYVY